MSGHQPGQRSDVGRALRADADAAGVLEVDAAWGEVVAGVRRRRHRRQRVAVAGVALGVAGLVLGAQDLTPHGVRQATHPRPLPAATATASPSPVLLRDVAHAPTPDQARQAFSASGYGHDDAFALGVVWRWGDADQVEAVAGLLLLRGESLPLRAGQPASAAAPGQPALYRTKVAFTDAGYSEADTTALAARWGVSTDTVQVFVGQLVLDGDVPGAR